MYYIGHYVHTGVKINTPHYLVKLTNLPHGTHTFTIIVSQLESLDNIYFTIKVSNIEIPIYLYIKYIIIGVFYM